jgi:exopolyphosphatase/guanosine-5'-triphosphate,3'-diphosphate pyrophosphatase
MDELKKNKMILKKYAAIDIGSNAIRLLITNVVEQEDKPAQFNKSELFRVPIRLGKDSFTLGEISDKNQDRMIKTMQAYKNLMDVYEIERYKACATSAMREAENAKEVVEKIFEKSGIIIDIIDGKTEASIIASTDLKNYMLPEKNYLYVDVGGGSTEFSFFSKGQILTSKSFRIGTVRLLHNMVNEAVWEEIEKWITKHTSDYEEVIIIGSGGNINKIFKLSGKTQDQPLSYLYLQNEYNKLNNMTYEERITEMALNPDRADVIIPATKIYVKAMQWSGAKNIYVPKIGLADGIIKALYYGRIS